MSITRFRLARASRPERQVIDAMRAVGHGADISHSFPALCRDALHELVRIALQQGYAIWTPGNDYVGPDELRLVGWLALFQRECVELLRVLDQELLIPLRDAAAILKPSHFLPYQAVLRAGFVSGQPIGQVRAGSEGERQRANGARRQQVRPMFHETIRARAVAFVRKHGRVSTSELGAIGVSPQYLSVLRHKGVLIRVRHGYYEVPPLDRTLSVDGAAAVHALRNFHPVSGEALRFSRRPRSVE